MMTAATISVIGAALVAAIAAARPAPATTGAVPARKARPTL